MSISQHHFWIASGPFIESTLILAPAPLQGERMPCGGSLKFFDADGSLVNESEVQLTNEKIAVFELAQFLSSCKLESGIRHGHLFLESSGGLSPHVRFHTKDQAFFSESSCLISQHKSNFFPVTISPHQTSMLCLVNHGQSEVEVRCRLLFKKRSPETNITIPPMGAYLMSVDAEFADYIASDSRTINAYLRIGIKGDGKAGVNLLQKMKLDNDRESYSMVS